MNNAMAKRDRLSIDVFPEEHKQIKAFAALHGETIREYVLECVRERVRRESEEAQLMAMTTKPGQVLKDLWDNEKDAQYDTVQ
ncbi:MAG: hypothetical protein ABH883_02785 [Candidatus Omnitrophota bacterium]